MTEPMRFLLSFVWWLPEPFEGSCILSYQVKEDTESSSLAATVRPQQAKHLSFMNFCKKTIDGLYSAVFL